MPRRKSTKLKRLTGKTRPIDRADANVKKWNKASDIPMDEENEFHSSRDRILLDEGANSDTDEDEEVFGLKGLADDHEYDDSDDHEAMLSEEEVEADEEHKKPKPKATKKQKKKTSKANTPPSSDEESEWEETWGTSKTAYYSSNAAQLDSEDEEGNELEEQEAKRLQAKAREGMSEDDFGLNDTHDLETPNDMDILEEPQAPAISSLPQDRKLLVRHLEKTSPETLALARDWEETSGNLVKLQERLTTMEHQVEPDAHILGMLHLHYQTLLTYTTTLAFYFYLRSSAKYTRRPETLQTHPILSRLLTLKQALVTFEDLDIGSHDSDDSEDLSEGYNDDDGETLESFFAELQTMKKGGNDKKAMFDSDELEELLREANEANAKRTGVSSPKKKQKTDKAGEEEKKKKKAEKSKHVFDLVEPQFVSSNPSSSRHGEDVNDVYGEATSLQTFDAADKKARKKSLRFHTSKIENASARRQGARSQALGGDDDIPYRERKKDREARLAKEAAGKVKNQGGADLDEEEPGSRIGKRLREEDDDGDEYGSDAQEAGEDGYYELVKQKTKEKKVKKKEDHDATREALQAQLGGDDTPDGPRGLTRAILANKGLTPHRSKSVRNPRVKKRQKFEKAKRKVSSQKAVYKGGIGDSGHYGGEKTGISKVIKSVKLG